MTKPRLKFWQIWNMSVGFFGIQFGWGLQMANMSTIYQYLGAEEGDIPILWLAAPLTGLIIQPIIGYYSDRTWTRLGRRRPYFLFGAIFASLALLAMPNSSALWMAAGLLWILDASVNVSMEPFRAFVGDMLPSEQRKVGFAMQSVLIGAGAVLSSMLPFVLTNGFGVSGESTAESAIPATVHLAFTIGAFIFFLAVVYTVVTNREYPPEDIAAFEKMKKESAGWGNAFREIVSGITSMPKTMRKLAWVQFFTWFALFCMWIYFAPGVAKNIFGGVPLGVTDQALNEKLDADHASLFNTAVLVARGYGERKAELAKDVVAPPEDSGGLLAVVGLKAPPSDPAERLTVGDLQTILQAALESTAPSEASEAERDSPMIRTIAAQLLTVTRGPEGNVDLTSLNGAANALSERLAKARKYQEGAAWAGVCFAAYNLTAFFFAFLLLWLVRHAAARNIHIACLTLGGVGFLSILWIDSPNVLLFSMIGIGMAWASILAMPYAMLSNALPANKMGFYMGVFNFFIVLPQILASVGLGKVMEHFLHNDSMKAILLGGFAMIIAALLNLRIDVAETE